MCRPVPSFLKLARQGEIKDEDDTLSSRPVFFQGCPTSKNQRRRRTAFCRPVQFRPVQFRPVQSRPVLPFQQLVLAYQSEGPFPLAL